MGNSENIRKWSKTAASNDAADAGVNWAEGQSPASVNNSGRGMMAAVAKWRDDLQGQLTTTGSQPAYVLTTNTGYTTYEDGLELGFVCHATNAGGASTLNVDALGAKKIRKVDVTATEVALAANDLVTNGHYIVRYDASADTASGAFILLNPTGVSLGSSAAVSTELDRISSTRGVILYRGASAWSALGTGTATYALLTGGAGADPAWGFVNTTASMAAGEFFANTANRLLTPAGVWADAAPVSKGNTSTAISLDCSTFINATMTATGNFTATFSNGKAGQGGSIWIATGAGSFTMTLAVSGGTVRWTNGTAGVLTTTASKEDRLDYLWKSSTVCDFSLAKNQS